MGCMKVKYSKNAPQEAMIVRNIVYIKIN